MLYAVILGIVQGLTEFLPVSSSGHLVIFQHVFGLREAELLFDISLHLGTMVAVIIVFRKEIRAMITSILRFLLLLIKKKASFSDINKSNDLKLAFLIIIGSVPTAVIGLMFNSVSKHFFSSVVITGSMLLVTGFFLWSTYRIKQDGRSMDGFTIKDALLIGVVQGIAVIPGISRSGATITAGLLLGLNRETAAGYSFLLSLPAIIGAALLSLNNLTDTSVFSAGAIMLGTLTSCIVGYFALKLLLRIVKHGRLYIFAPYCCVAGIVALPLI